MNDNLPVTTAKRGIWVRGLLMIVLGLAYQLASTVLVVIAILQFVFAIANNTSNERLRGFGVSLGRYLGQIADFECFATEQLPFPFADWPSGP